MTAKNQKFRAVFCFKKRKNMKINFNKIHLRSDDTVDYIKSNIRIEDVINRLAGLNLTKTGNSLQGDCPSGTFFPKRKMFQRKHR